MGCCSTLSRNLQRGRSPQNRARVRLPRSPELRNSGREGGGRGGGCAFNGGRRRRRAGAALGDISGFGSRAQWKLGERRGCAEHTPAGGDGERAGGGRQRRAALSREKEGRAGHGRHQPSPILRHPSRRGRLAPWQPAEQHPHTAPFPSGWVWGAPARILGRKPRGKGGPSGSLCARREGEGAGEGRAGRDAPGRGGAGDKSLVVGARGEGRPLRHRHILGGGFLLLPFLRLPGPCLAAGEAGRGGGVPCVLGGDLRGSWRGAAPRGI